MSERIRQMRQLALRVPELKQYAMDATLSDLDFLRKVYVETGRDMDTNFGDFAREYGYEGPVGSFAATALDSAALGFGGEIEAMVKTALNDKSFDENLKASEIDESVAAYRRFSPDWALLADAAGFAIPGLGAMRGAKALGMGATGIRSLAAQNAAVAGAYGVGSGETLEERVMGGLVNAAVGGATGATFGLPGAAWPTAKNLGNRALNFGQEVADRVRGIQRPAPGVVRRDPRGLMDRLRNKTFVEPGNPNVMPDQRVTQFDDFSQFGPTPDGRINFIDRLGGGIAGEAAFQVARVAGAPRVAAYPARHAVRKAAERYLGRIRQGLKNRAGQARNALRGQASDVVEPEVTALGQPVPSAPEPSAYPAVDLPGPRPRPMGATPQIVPEAKEMFDDVFTALARDPIRFADPLTADAFNRRFMEMAEALAFLDKEDLIPNLRKYLGKKVDPDAGADRVMLEMLRQLRRDRVDGALEDRVLRLMFSKNKGHRAAARAIMALDEVDQSTTLFREIAGEEINTGNIDTILGEDPLNARVQALLDERIKAARDKGHLRGPNPFPDVPHPGDVAAWDQLMAAGDLGNPGLKGPGLGVKIPASERDTQIRARQPRARKKVDPNTINALGEPLPTPSDLGFTSQNPLGVGGALDSSTPPTGITDNLGFTTDNPLGVGGAFDSSRPPSPVDAMSTSDLGFTSQNPLGVGGPLDSSIPPPGMSTSLDFAPGNPLLGPGPEGAVSTGQIPGRIGRPLGGGPANSTDMPIPNAASTDLPIPDVATTDLPLTELPIPELLSTELPIPEPVGGVLPQRPRAGLLELLLGLDRPTAQELRRAATRGVAATAAVERERSKRRRRKER